MKSEIHLTAVNKENWLKCAHLELHESQKDYLASNLATIAESKFEPHYVLRAITLEGKIIGMLAYCPEVDEPIEGLYWLFRIMLDCRYQGRGYGKQAIIKAVEEMKVIGATRIHTMCKPENLGAKKTYLDLGFRQIGHLDDGDIEFEMLLIEAPA
jgi:diamine N-acetyltransferase